MRKIERKKRARNKAKGAYYPAADIDGIKWLIGIDEVGRGPLAGPVAVCACAIPYQGGVKESHKAFIERYKKEIKKLKLRSLKGRDSKLLAPEERKAWKSFLDSSHAVFEYGSAPAEVIDSDGIAVCIRRLVEENLENLLKKITSADMPTINTEVIVLLDGALKAPAAYMHQKTIIKGDSKELVISLASIFAKVTRDAHMMDLAKEERYSPYLFDIHKGYGTPKHMKLIRQHGLSPLHRRSFCTRIPSDRKKQF